MKGGFSGGTGISSYGPSTKRRWRGSVIAVLGLVILSMLVPLVFLLGLHNGFHSTGSLPEQQSSVSQNSDGENSLQDSRNLTTQPKKDNSRHVDELMEKLGPWIQKDIRVAANKTNGGHHDHGQDHQLTGLGHQNVAKQIPESSQEVKVNGPIGTEQAKVDENELSCELRYGSYCLWRCKYRDNMMDAIVKKMKDLLFVARAYYPSIAKLSVHEKLSKELRQNIQDFERVLSESSSDADLPHQVEKKLQKMESAISKSKLVHGVNCGNVDKKFRQLLDLTEDEANFHTRQSAFLYKLAVQTMPKSHHCLSMRLALEYFQSPLLDEEALLAQRSMDTTLYHYVIFSNNILASSVVINSTVTNAKDSRRLVFHVLTDKQNYFSMRLWFMKNSYKEAAVRILNVEDQELMFKTEAVPHFSMPEEFRVSLKSAKMQHTIEYMSLFSYSHYTLAEIFQGLDKIVILDDDVLVQQDLSALWNIDLKGKVNGAIEYCGVTLGQLNKFLGESSFNQKSCAWMSGLNVVDLSRWRELDLTRKFRSLVQELNMEGTSFGAVASRASLLTFQDQVYALDGAYVMSGLGHDYGLDLQAIRKAAVLHYNGNMKPWLDLGIPRYKGFWTKYINRESHFLSECNVSP